MSGEMARGVRAGRHRCIPALPMPDVSAFMHPRYQGECVQG